MTPEGLKYYLKHPGRLFNYLSSRDMLDWMNDELYIKLQYRFSTGHWPNLREPKSFNEKMNWLKLHDRKPLYTRLVDKYSVREFIGETIGKEYLIPLLGGPWDSVDEIDFELLPEQFVLKCTHDSGGLVICKNKAQLNLDAARAKLKKSLDTNFYWRSREWPYKDVKPRIIAEKLMSDDKQPTGLIDFKFFCCNGKADFMYVSKGLEDHATAGISFFDLDCAPLPFRRLDFAPLEAIPYRPENLEQMIKLSNTLAEIINCPFVRCDFYEIDGRVYFSEITFTPCGGLLPFHPAEWDEKLGQNIILD